jgi:hypothetical protein
MAGTGFNPNIVQGNLNRVATHIVVTSFTALNVTASYMTKDQAKLTIDGPFVDQIETATGIINSPKPFVMGTIVINLLRSQSLANLWIQQALSQCYLGQIVAYSDSSVFDALTITQASIVDFDPGPYNGENPAVPVTVKGTFPINSALWATLTGSSGLLPVAL